MDDALAALDVCFGREPAPALAAALKMSAVRRNYSCSLWQHLDFLAELKRETQPEYTIGYDGRKATCVLLLQKGLLGCLQHLILAANHTTLVYRHRQRRRDPSAFEK